MSVEILFLIVLIAMLFYIRNRINQAGRIFQMKWNAIAQYVTHPNIIVAIIGKLFLDRALTTISKIFFRR